MPCLYALASCIPGYDVRWPALKLKLKLMLKAEGLKKAEELKDCTLDDDIHG